MRIRCFTIVVTAVAVALAGCANHPIVDDVTRFSTYDVVHKVRCEARGPIAEYARAQGYSSASVAALDKKIAHYKKAQAGEARARAFAEYQRVNAQIDANARQIRAVRVQIAALEPRITAFQLEARSIGDTIEDSVPAFLEQLSKPVDEDTAKRLFERASRLEERARLSDHEKEKIEETLRTLREELKRREAINRELQRDIRNAERDTEQYVRADKELAALVAAISAEPVASEIKFMKSNIAMQFRFDITEFNTASVDGSYKMPFASGSLVAAFGAGTSNKRRGERAIGISTTFAKLIDVECESAKRSDRTRAEFYPIRGNIGIAELMTQYLKIAEGATLGTSAATAGTTKQFTDRLVFTTKVGVGVTPKLELNPTPVHKLALNGNIGVEREDIHEVIVDIAAPGRTSVSEPTRISVENVPDIGIRVIQEQDIGDIE